MIFAFGACCALGCHGGQKFPALAPAQVQASSEPQMFAQKPSGLDDSHTFTDLSAMNREAAGARGFVSVKLGHFSDDSGARLRFFGVNLTGVACLPDHDTARRLARHFSKLGFNAVRLYALDTPGALMQSDGHVSPEALDRLDFFTSELAAHGIYFSLSLHAVSGYPGLTTETQSSYPAGRVLDRFHAAFLDAQEDFAGRLLRHQSPYTLRRYNAEPALLYVELNSEDTLFPSWAGSPDDAPQSFRAELAQGYAPWLAERTADGLRAPGPALQEAAGGLPTFHDSGPAQSDYAQYLRGVELSHVKALAAFVRQDLGLRSLLINSQASCGGLAGVLRENEVSDFIDMHGYWDSPRRDGARSSGQNAPQVSAPGAGILGVMASYRVFGKPFTVSEYASAAPNAYAAEMFPLLIGVAGLQDWDAVFAFAYADQQRDYEPTRINGLFDMAGHPAKLAFVTMAASAFRRGLVAPGQSRVELNVPEQPSALPFTESALPDLWSENGVPQTAAVLRQVGISVRPGGGNVSASFALQVTGALGSDTGELLWDNQGPHARFSIDSPTLKVACGMLAGSLLNFSGVSLEFGEFSPRFACASLLSLDDQPIASARRLLLTVAGTAYNARRSQARDHTASAALGGGPALAQYVPVTVTLPAALWHAAALDATGAPLHALPVMTAGQSVLSTSFDTAALSYAITR